MRQETVSRRYAQALFEIGREGDRLEELERDLDLVVQVVTGDEQLQQLVEYPLLPAQVKKDILTRAFGKAISGTTLNFLCLVLDKRREGYLAEIASSFKALADEARQLTEAEVKSAVPLTADQVKDLETGLARIAGGKVRLQVEVDPTIVGGLMVKIGDRVIDGTVNQRLQALKSRLQNVDFREIGVRQ